MALQGKNFVLRLAVFLAVLLIVSRARNVSGKMQIGINLGLLGDNLPSIERTVELLSDMHAGAVRLYDANPEVLNALSNRPHDVIVSVRNDQLSIIATNPDAADGWLQWCVVPFYPATKITFIAVGNEVLREGNIETDGQYLCQALINIYSALVARNLHDNIKVISPLSGEILGTSWPPSDGHFENLEYMRPLLQFLQDTGSTFFINLYPYYAHIANIAEVPFEYAAFQAREQFSDPMSDVLYSNLFECMLDAAYNAMESLGFPDLPLAVGETGWPTAGGHAATVQNAELFNTNLVKHVYSKGTPQRPNVRTPVFIFALFNENQKPGPAFERAWGLLNADGTPVYPIDLRDPDDRDQEVPTMPLASLEAIPPAFRSTPDDPVQLADPSLARVPVPEVANAPALPLAGAGVAPGYAPLLDPLDPAISTAILAGALYAFSEPPVAPRAFNSVPNLNVVLDSANWPAVNGTESDDGTAVVPVLDAPDLQMPPTPGGAVKDGSEDGSEHSWVSWDWGVGRGDSV